jgi:hypothetical protein
MVPYVDRPKVEELYALFSKEPYDPKLSWVLPSEFKLDPLLQSTVKQFAEDVKPDPNPPFILAGPEFNTIR